MAGDMAFCITRHDTSKSQNCGRGSIATEHWRVDGRSALGAVSTANSLDLFLCIPSRRPTVVVPNCEPRLLIRRFYSEGAAILHLNLIVVL
jgi:hypothetical protein